MKQRRMSLIERFVTVKPGRAAQKPESSPPDGAFVAPSPATPRLKGSALEQAYRKLLLENQVLAESNERLHERIARQEKGLEESPAAKELIRSQRNALADGSRRLRELQYEVQGLKRDKKKLVEENRKLAASLARHMQDIQPLLHQGEVSRRELAAAKTALREKTNELLKLTDKYYQLEARMQPRPPPSSAANGRF